MTTYLRCNGQAGRYASAPDSAALSITGDIDVRCRAALDDWTPVAAFNTLMAKWGTSSQGSWGFWVLSSGKMQLSTSSTGSSSAQWLSSVATGVADGSVKWARVTRVAASGLVKFYLSDDGTSWTQLGTDVAGTSGNIFDSTALLTVGAYNDDGSQYPAVGWVYRAQVLAGIDGTVVFDADFADRLVTFTESSSNATTVTIRPSLYEPTWLPAEAVYGQANHYGYEPRDMTRPEHPKTSYPAATGGTTYPVEQ